MVAGGMAARQLADSTKLLGASHPAWGRCSERQGQRTQHQHMSSHKLCTRSVDRQESASRLIASAAATQIDDLAKAHAHEISGRRAPQALICVPTSADTSDGVIQVPQKRSKCLETFFCLASMLWDQSPPGSPLQIIQPTDGLEIWIKLYAKSD